MNSLVWAIVVCYSPSREELIRLLHAIKGQVPTTLVMNNGGISPELLIELKAMPEVRLVDMNGNLGIASALNRAFEQLAMNGIDFGITFDQDSQPPPNHVSRLVDAWSELNRQPRRGGQAMGAIGPSFYDIRNGRFDYPFFRAKGIRVQRIYENSGEIVPEADALITSGMLLPVCLWNKFRFMENLFIDYVDTEWCFRTRNAGYQHYGCFDVKMQHELSEGQPIAVLGMILLRYNPLRRYYYFRNGAYLATRSYVPAIFRIRLVVGMLIRAVTSPLIDPHPLRSLRFICRGLLDAMRGRFDRLDL